MPVGRYPYLTVLVLIDVIAIPNQIPSVTQTREAAGRSKFPVEHLKLHDRNFQSA